MLQSYGARWLVAHIDPKREAEVSAIAEGILKNKAVYQGVETDTKVPWWVVGVIHYREASLDLTKSLAQGDPWDKVSTHVPRGRGPFTSFRACAFDALVRCAPGAGNWKDWTAAGTLTILVLYNGTGYEDYHHEASPYVWGATDQEEWGKYVSDGIYNPKVWDTQVGCAAIIMRLMALDDTIKFELKPRS